MSCVCRGAKGVEQLQTCSLVACRCTSTTPICVVLPLSWPVPPSEEFRAAPPDRKFLHLLHVFLINSNPPHLTPTHTRPFSHPTPPLLPSCALHQVLSAGCAPRTSQQALKLLCRPPGRVSSSHCLLTHTSHMWARHWAWSSPGHQQQHRPAQAKCASLTGPLSASAAAAAAVTRPRRLARAAAAAEAGAAARRGVQWRQWRVRVQQSRR